MVRSFDLQPSVAQSAKLAAARPILVTEYRHSADEDGSTNDAESHPTLESEERQHAETESNSDRQL